MLETKLTSDVERSLRQEGSQPFPAKILVNENGELDGGPRNRAQDGMSNDPPAA